MIQLVKLAGDQFGNFLEIALGIVIIDIYNQYGDGERLNLNMFRQNPMTMVGCYGIADGLLRMMAAAIKVQFLVR